MALRSAHGHRKGKGPRIETLPHDELPTGIPAPRPGELPGDRNDKGRFTPGNSLAGVAGKAKTGRVALTRLGGLHAPEPLPALKPYIAHGKSFRQAHCRELAYTVGGGVCGPAVSIIVAMAARCAAWQQYYGDLSDVTGDIDLAGKAMKFGETAKQHLAMAMEMCAKAALARSKVDAMSPHEALEMALTEGEGKDK